MAVSQQQKVDFLLKKLGFTKTKTGLAVDSTLTGTKKAGFAEAIPSPLIIANSSVWNEADSIPATPPGSDTNQVRVYLAASSGHRMTVDSTVASNRAFIAFSTYNDTSSSRLNNWIDTQFGAGYLIKVFKGDPNSGGVQLSAAGSGANDGWFFDYSAGVLNFNDTNVPSGVTGTNIYIVGYRYIGQTGAPTSGISTFSFLDLSVERNLDVGVQGGISTFRNNIDANGIIEGIAGENKIPFLYSNLAALPSASTYHGMFAHVHSEGRGYFAHAGNWLELVNKDTSGNVSLSGDLDVDGHTNLDNVSVAGVSTFSDTVKVGTGVTALTNGNVSIGGTFEIFESSGIANRNFSQFKLSNFSISQHQNTGSYFIKNSSTGQLIIGGGANGNGGVALYNNNLGAKYLRTHSEGSVEIFHDNTVRFETSGIGATVYGQLDTTDLDVDGHTNLDNVSVAGVTTFGGNATFATDGYFTTTTGITIENSQPGIIFSDTNANPDFIIQNRQGSFAIRDITSAANRFFVNAANGDVTVTGGIDVSGDLDVDGHTNLDNVSIAGVTTATGLVGFGTHVTLQDGAQIRLGERVSGGNRVGDFIISHDTSMFGDTYNRIDSSNGNMWIVNRDTVKKYMYIRSNDIQLRDWSNNEAYIHCKTDAEVELYYNGSQKLETTNTGIDVTGNVVSDGLVVDGNFDLNGDIDVDGHTNLDNVSVSGVSTFTGDALFIGNVSIGGTLTYEDVKNVDAVGLITARSGIRVLSGVIEAQAGENKIPSLYANLAALPSASTYHGMFAHVHSTGRGYFAHAGNWLELVNKDTSGNVGLSGDLDVDGHTNLDNVSIAGVTTFAGAIDANGNLDVAGIGTIGSGASGYAELFYQGVKKFETKNYGALIPGSLVATYDIKVGSYVGKLIAGTNNEFTIQHDNTNTIIDNTVGILDIKSQQVAISTHLSVGGISTFSGNVDINADIDVDGHTNLDNLSVAGVSTFADRVTISGGKDLFMFDNGVIRLGNNSNTADFQMFHDGGHTRLNNATGSLYIQNTATGGSVAISAKSGQNGIVVKEAPVRLYYDNTLRFSTSGVGATVYGNLDVTADLDVDGHTNLDNVSVAGVTTTVGDVNFTGTDYNAFWDESLSALRFNDNAAIRLGNTQDLQIYHSSSGSGNSYIDNSTGILFLRNTGTNGSQIQLLNNNSGFKIQALAGEQSILGVANGQVELYHNNSKKLATTGIGATVFGQLDTTDLNVTGVSTFTGAIDANSNLDVDGHTNLDNVSVAGVSTFSDNVRIIDNKSLLIGDLSNGDLSLVHDGNNSVIRNRTGNLYISNATDTGILVNGSTGAVNLSFGGDLKLETETEGVKVTGRLRTTGDLDVDGHTNLDNVSIAGVSTFTGNIDANGDLDVDGHTNLDNVNVSGITTFANNVHAANVFTSYLSSSSALVAVYADIDDYVDVGSNIKLGNAGIITATGADINGDIDVDGHTNLDNVSVAGVTTFTGTTEFDSNAKFDSTITAGGATGTNGQYLKSTGSGVAWASFPTARTSQAFTASAGQTTFSFSYTVGLVDVFVNGIKLSTSEFTATNGSSVVLAVGCFVGDIVEILSYNTATGGGGGGTLSNIVEDTTPQLGGNLDLFNKTITGTGSINITGVATATKFVGDGSGLVGVIASGTGVIIKNSGSTVGTAGTINFGDNLSVSALSGGAVTISAGAASTSDVSTNSLNVVGIATLGSGSSGQAILQYQGNTKLTSESWGTRTTGTVQALAGNLQQYQASANSTGNILLTNQTGNALKIGHANSNSFITGIVGNININAPTVSISTNFSVGGISTFSEGLFIPDDKKLEIGNAAGNGDLQLYYDSTPGESLITHTGPGVFKIEGNTSNNIFIRPKSGQNSITAKPNAEVELYYNGVQRFETTSQGIEITGHSELDNVNISGVVTATTFKGALEATSASFSSNIDANGDLDVDGHTNLDNVSIAGVTTGTTINATTFVGNGDFVELDVDGHTNLDNVSVVGIVTVTNSASGIGLKLIDASNKQFFAGGGGGGTPFAGSSTGHDFRIQVGGLQNAIFKYAAGATGNLELGPSSGIGITFNGSTGNAGYAGIITASKFVGDGSGLTGITASGSGVVIKHDGSTVGTAGTINFSTNLDVSAISAGIVTITASGGTAGLTTDAQGNTIGGANAGANFDGTAQRNTLIGHFAGNDITTGDYNTCVGALAGDQITVNGYHTYIGYNAGGQDQGSGFGRNTAIGSNAGANIRSSYGAETNVAVGAQCFSGNSGSANVYMGYYAGGSMGGPESSNVAIGYQAMQDTESAANNNVAIGRETMEVVERPNNVAIGYKAGETLGHGENNIIIGANSAASSTTADNEITLGDTNITKFRIPGIGVTFKDNGGTPTQGHVLTVDANGEASFAAASGGTDVGITTNLSGSFTASAGSPSTINTFGYGSGDIVVEYTVFIKNGSDFQSQKLLAMRDGTTIHSTQFAVMYSSSLLVQLDATISSGNILLRATPETGVSGSTTYKIKREVM